MIIVVAVDGAAGSGKSSVSRAAARELGYDYLDTGAAYRALAWRCRTGHRHLRTGRRGSESLDSFELRMGIDPDEYFVRVGSEDVTGDIREPRGATSIVSQVARIPEVREYLVELFRGIMAGTSKPGIVVEGRDITTGGCTRCRGAHSADGIRRS